MRTKAIFLGLLLAGWVSGAAEVAVKEAEQARPTGLAAGIASLLQPNAIEVSRGGKTVARIWLAKEMSLKEKPSSPASAVDAIADAALVGALSVPEAGLKDYKDNEIPKGVYTLRYVRQPQDGDHLGTAEFNSFVALVGADVDKEASTFTKFTPLVKASGKLTASGHPVVLSLRPPSAENAKAPSVTEPAAEHKAVRLNLSGKTASGEKVAVPVELVIEGHGHIQ